MVGGFISDARRQTRRRKTKDAYINFSHVAAQRRSRLCFSNDCGKGKGVVMDTSRLTPDDSRLHTTHTSTPLSTSNTHNSQMRTLFILHSSFFTYHYSLNPSLRVSNWISTYSPTSSTALLTFQGVSRLIFTSILLIWRTEPYVSNSVRTIGILCLMI